MPPSCLGGFQQVAKRCQRASRFHDSRAPLFSRHAAVYLGRAILVGLSWSGYLDWVRHWAPPVSTDMGEGMMTQPSFEITEKTVDEMLISGVRMKGKYSDCGQGFSKIGKHFGFSICGKPFCLHYDQEKKEDDADFEACLPVRSAKEVDGISTRLLPGGRCLTLLHLGPYENIGDAYRRVKDHITANGIKTRVPSREVYVKGPGMIFRSNPRKYLTEIQFMIDE